MDTTGADNVPFLAALKFAFSNGVTAFLLGLFGDTKFFDRIGELAGITREAVYKSLSDKCDPKLSTLLGVMKALGMQLTLTTGHKAA